MKDTICLKSAFSLNSPYELKRYAILFNRIGLMDYKSELYESIGHPDIDWLFEQGIVFDPSSDFHKYRIRNYGELDNTSKDLWDQLFEIQSRIADSLPEIVTNENKMITGELAAKINFNINDVNNIFLRLMSLQYRKSQGSDVFPILERGIPDHLPEPIEKSANLETVFQITLNNIPKPNDTVSWEKIIEFRDDPDTKGKFLGLRNWMNDISKANINPLEIEQKLEWLLHEYEQHMKFHRMKTNASTLETILVTTGEIAEDLVKFKFGKLAKLPFSIRQRKLALLEGELKAPGREVAFISKAQETFR